ncbi:MAG: hypothetical protein J1F23_03805 [Oscillospiraceae bacterium]|nr:hypothetical protein [Oscillospiraceae bacterium]
MKTFQKKPPENKKSNKKNTTYKSSNRGCSYAVIAGVIGAVLLDIIIMIIGIRGDSPALNIPFFPGFLIFLAVSATVFLIDHFRR